MLNIKFIRENPDTVKTAAQNKNFKIDIDRILELDKNRRDTMQIIENLRAEQNKTSHLISATHDKGERENLIRAMRDVKSNMEDVELTIEKTESELNVLLKSVPNIPFDNVPVGKNDASNIVLREVGGRPKFEFNAADYLQIAERYNWIDIDRAAKVSGSRFGYIKGDLAMLEFAIIRYTLDFLTNRAKLSEVISANTLEVSDKPFIPVLPPVLVKPEYMDAMGFLAGDIGEDIYFLEKDNLYLVGTSEQSIGTMHANETFKEEDLPARYAGFSTCFRREAGSYGKDTKGILRVHQFDKVEMISLAHPKKSREEHKFLLSINEAMMQDLALPYRVVHICTGDLGLAKAEQFDIETWIPSEGRYRETHSASNITDFQARRLNIKYKSAGEQRHIHMLNDTAFALGRILIAIIENYQTKDGKVKIPEALKGYMGFKEIPR